VSDDSSALPGGIREVFLSALDAFEAARVPYAVLGGIAVILHGVPRLTVDADFVLGEERIAWPRVLSDLERRGFAYGAPGAPPRAQVDALEDLRRDSMTVLWKSRVRIDLLQAADPLHQEALRERQAVVAFSRTIPVVRPEHLLVTKWIAGRPKDLLDVDGILAAQGARLDLARVRAWLPAIESSGGLSVQAFEARVRSIVGSGSAT